MKNFSRKSLIFFLTFAQNIDCGYTLESPRRGSSNEFIQSMFWSKNKENRYTRNRFFYKKVGFKCVYFSLSCSPDIILNITRKASHASTSFTE